MTAIVIVALALLAAYALTGVVVRARAECRRTRMDRTASEHSDWLWAQFDQADQ